MTFANRKFLGFLCSATVVIVAEYVIVLSDSVIAGKILGEHALSAVNLLMSAFSVCSFFTWLLAEGTAIAYSDAVARMHRILAANLAGQGLVAAIAIGCVLGVATMLLGGPYLAFMSPDSGIAELFMSYWRWYPAVILLESVDLMLLYLVYADGGKRSCLVSYCLQVASNIALSYGFCRGVWGLPELGMGGIALGTACAYLVGIGALLPRLLDREASGLRFVPRFLPRDFVHTLKLSFGDASAVLFHALLFFVVSKYIIHEWGTSVLPIATVVFCILRLTVFFNGIGIALQPLETVYHGEGNTTGVRSLVRFAAVVAVSEGLVISIVVYAAPWLFVSLMGIKDAALAEGAEHAVRLTVLGLAGYAVAYMLNSHYQFVGRPGRSIALTLLAFFAVPVALLFSLGRMVGMDGVWIALSSGPAVAVGGFLLLRRRRAQSKAPAVWSLPVSDLVACRHVAEQAARVLAGDLPKEAADQVASVVGKSLRRIRVYNGAGRRVIAEVTAMSDGQGAKLVIRDDGLHFALENMGYSVTHLPAAGFNRNIFALDAVKCRKDNRYEIVRGLDMTLKELEDVAVLDDQNYVEECYHKTAGYNRALFGTNKESGIAVRDRQTGSIVGYMMLLPISDAMYSDVRAGVFVDSDLTPEMVARYGDPGVYHLYFTSVVVHPEHRSIRMVLLMMDAIAEEFLDLANRGIFIDKMIADCVSGDGVKFCRLFGLDKVRASDHDSDIYEVCSLPPRFRESTPILKRLAEVYREKYAALSSMEAGGAR